QPLAGENLCVESASRNSSCTSFRQRRRAMYCLTNAWIGAAAADVAGHCLVNIFVCGLRLFPEQYSGAHELTGLTVAALWNVHFEPRLLQRMRQIGGESFDGGYIFAYGARDRSHTRAHGLTINVDRARAALRHAAAVLGSSQPQIVTQYPE